MAPTKKVKTIAYLQPAQKKALDALHRMTRVPRAELMREAVDDLLKKRKCIGGEK